MGTPRHSNPQTVNRRLLSIQGLEAHPTLMGPTANIDQHQLDITPPITQKHTRAARDQVTQQNLFWPGKSRTNRPQDRVPESDMLRTESPERGNGEEVQLCRHVRKRLLFQLPQRDLLYSVGILSANVQYK
jgi:hypothetical protein